MRSSSYPDLLLGMGLESSRNASSRPSGTADPKRTRCWAARPAHAQRHQAARGEYITAFNDEGKEVDISFATQNWRKAVLDKTRTGQFVRKHFEAMVFTAFAEELRTSE
ncbi:hypothetical protein [Streptomyces sp. NPDC055709]